jgi:hypothetical protein
VIRSWKRTASISDDMLIRPVGALGNLPALWNLVGESTKLRVVSLAHDSSADVLLAGRFFSSGRPADSEVAAAYDTAATTAAEDFERLDRLVKQYGMELRQWIPAALTALRESNSFRSAESRLRCLMRLAGVLSISDLEHMAFSVRDNYQINHAGDTPSLLLNLYRETIQIPEADAVWKDLANGLHQDYLDKHSDADGSAYYSYSELLTKVTSGA